jgi:hypothetical protein
MAAPRRKKARTESARMAVVQQNNQAASQRRQQTKSKGPRSSQTEQVATEAYSDAQLHHPPPAEYSSFGTTESTSPHFGGQDVFYGPGYLPLGVGLGDYGNGFASSPYIPNSTGNFHSSNATEGISLPNTEGNPSNDDGERTISNAYADLFFDDDAAGDGHDHFEIDCRNPGSSSETSDSNGDLQPESQGVELAAESHDGRGLVPNLQNVESRLEFEKDPAQAFFNEVFDFESFPDDPSQ